MNPSDPAIRDQTEQSKAQDASPVLHWSPAPEAMRLDRGQIHLWAVALDEFVGQSPKFTALLSTAEQARAQKFRFVQDRDRYVIRRGLLRLILSRYLDKIPSAIEFQLGPHGKPEMRWDGSNLPLFFNASHSAGIAIYAITSACPIGVDVEQMREISEIEKIASHFFQPSETRTLMSLPSDVRMDAFYSCWTRKEAYLKATGEGIAESLAKVEVTLAPGDEPRIASITGDREVHKQWCLQPFSPAPGYLGCIAYRNAVLTVNPWRADKSILQGHTER